MLDTVLRMLAEHPMERLKWRVCREFGVLPGSETARQLTDYDYVCCGANLLLDKRAREQSQPAESAAVNPQFDPARFAALKEGGRA